jgi:hypothetical protein
MSIDRMDLQAPLGTSPEADFLREMIGFAAWPVAGRYGQQERRTSSGQSDISPPALAG